MSHLTSLSLIFPSLKSAYSEETKRPLNCLGAAITLILSLWVSRAEHSQGKGEGMKPPFAGYPNPPSLLLEILEA